MNHPSPGANTSKITNNNRRTFRGRGFQDGNIPKSFHRPRASRRTNEHEDTIEPTSYLHAQEGGSDNTGSKARETDRPIHKDASTCSEKSSSHEPPSSNNNYTNPQEEAFLKEIREVQRKIRNLQESIQLSTNIAQPLVWQANGLNAALNIVNQWKAIVVFYSKTHDQIDSENVDTTRGEDDSNDLHERMKESSTILHKDSPSSEETALQVYGMIQMVMQTGPLKGSNPGYFKRCGVQVAKMAKEFLVNCIQNTTEKSGETMEFVENTDDAVMSETNINMTGRDCCYVVSNDLRFTSQQHTTLLKWIKDADKTIVANKLPSNSAMKLQTSINTKGMSRRDKRRKGQLVKNIVL
mmetsp:Transcript_13344/g.25043  ORF Transcript_13344/g.25043 Transcript_13344/m.25043 type:complete len:353 (-) Transcript_13344:43-1101(-)